MPPRKVPAPDATPHIPERRRATDTALESHLARQDKQWQGVVRDLETRLEKKFEEFKQEILEILRQFAEQNTLSDDERTYLRNHVAAWGRESADDVLARRKALDRTVVFVAGEEQHRQEVLAATKDAAEKLAHDLAMERKIAARRWKVAGQLAAVFIPSLLTLLGGIFLSQFQRLNTINPGVLVAGGLCAVAFVVIVFGIASYKLSAPEPTPPPTP